MAIESGNKVTLSDNGTSDWVKIPSGPDKTFPRIIVGNASNTWGASTSAAVQITGDATAEDPIPCPLLEADNATPVAFTENGHRVIENSYGFARIVITNYAGSSPITMQIV